MFGDKSAQRSCALCFEGIDVSLGFLERLWWRDDLCFVCREAMGARYRSLRMSGFKVHVLHEYSGLVRECVLRFKDFGDIFLGRIFLVSFRLRVFFFFHDWVVVCAPSHVDRIRARGFDHCLVLAGFLNLPVIEGVLGSLSSERQASKSREERLLIGKDLVLLDGSLLKGKKVLVLDDVMTTGSTLIACCELLVDHCVCVEALCVSYVPTIS